MECPDSVTHVPAIEVSGLVVRYDTLTAVRDVSFDVEAGEVVALLGPNGAGKTSTVETIEGFRRATAGMVQVLGLDPLRDRDELSAHVGIMLQEGGIYPGIRAREILTLYAAFFDAPVGVNELLGRVGLSQRAHATWRQLSGGEQQRLSLALALIGRPRVAILDEPTAGVDITGRQLVREVVRDLAKDGVAVLLTTHDLAEAEKVADRIVIINRGLVVGAGTPTELMSSSRAPEVRFGAPEGIDTAALGKLLATKVQEVTPGEYFVDTAPTPATIAAITAWLAERDLPLEDLRVGRQRLEDVFLALTSITGEHRAIDVSEPAPDDPENTPRRTRRRRQRHD